MHNRIKVLRKELGLNQTEFGQKIGVAQGSVASYESGARVPLNAIVERICEKFSVNEQWLRTGEGEMFARATVEDELASMFKAVATDPEDAFRKKVFLGLAKLDPADWELVEQIVKKMLDK